MTELSLRQSGFSGGLIGPALLGRSDLAKYATGLRVLRNAFVTRNGSLENRSGTIYVSNVKNSANPVELIKFVSTTGYGILMEVGSGYIRFFKGGAPIPVIPSGATTYSFGVTYNPGDTVLSAGVYYVCLQTNSANVPSYPGPTAYWRRILDTVWNNTTSYGIGDLARYNNGSGNVSYYSKTVANLGNQPDVSPTNWYAMSGTGLEIPTPMLQGSLATIQDVQLNDLMILVNQAFYPQQLTHLSDTNWTIANFFQTPGVLPPTGVAAIAGNNPGAAPPTGLAAVGGAPATTPDTYQVSAYGAHFVSNPSVFAVSTVGAATGANPVALNWTASGAAGLTGYYVYKLTSGGVYGFIGSTGAGVTTFNDTGITANPAIVPPSAITFLYVVTSINSTTGVESLASAQAGCVGLAPSASQPNTVSWVAATNASSYNVYEQVGGIFGYVGSSPTTTFLDTNIAPSIAKQPPVTIGLFGTPNDYPAVVGAYQQRLLFANTVNQPQTVWGSATSAYTVFTANVPVLDSSSIQFTVAGDERQFVQGLVDIGKLVVHTSAGEYVAYGNAFNTITPTAIGLVRNGSAGSALIQPVTIGTTDLFVQARGNMVRDLQYSIYTSNFAGKDTTLYVPHLFEGNSIVQLDWQQVFNSIVWIVQSSGDMLGMTYIKDQELWAWHEHDSYNGIIEKVCVVPEGTADTVYLVVKRQINGVTQRSIERLAPREFQDSQYLSDAIFTDCSLTYDGRNTSATTMTSSTAGTWTTTDPITLVASTGFFVVGDVGNAIQFRQLATGIELQPGTTIPYPVGWVIDSVTFTIASYTSATRVVCTPSKNVPTWAQGFGLATWGKMVHSFSGFSQLAGQPISAQGDGAVVFNALTDQSPTVVSNTGTFTTPANYLVLTAGLPLTSQIQTLPLEAPGRGETLMNKQVVVSEATVMFYNSRGGSYGQDFSHLFPWTQRGLAYENMSQPTSLFTGAAIITIQGSWQASGQVCIQQTDPLPMGISAITPSGFAGN